VPIPVAVRSKAWVCGRYLARIAGSNPIGDMNLCVLLMLCVVRWRSLRRAGHVSIGVIPSVVCLSMIVKPRKWTGPCPSRGRCATGKNDTRESRTFLQNVRKFLPEFTMSHSGTRSASHTRPRVPKLSHADRYFHFRLLRTQISRQHYK
jgi:hypothetical protein